MATFLVAHGAWSSGFVWKKMRPLLRAAGHELVTTSHTGLGDRRHLAHKDVDLDHHITDICAVLFQEDLREVILIGHSYGGMVATGVADRMPERLSQIVYLDAFVPKDGDSMMSLGTPEQRKRWQEGAEKEGGGWLVPPNPFPPDTAAEDLDWIMPRRYPQPVKTITQPIKLTGGGGKLPKSYIYCTRAGPGDMFGPFARAAKADPDWRYFDLDSSHNPHVTAPYDLARVLIEIADVKPGGSSP